MLTALYDCGWSTQCLSGVFDRPLRAPINTTCTSSVSHQNLVRGRIAVAVWLWNIDNLTHLLLPFFGLLDVPRSEVLRLSFCLGRSRDEALSGHSSKRDLADGTMLACSKPLDFLHDCFVLVEATLNFGTKQRCNH